MGFQTRTPTSNDLPKIPAKNPWLGENEIVDEVALLIGGLAERCDCCKRAIRIEYLDKNHLCPDCRKS